jgi:hypothetical protein
MHDIIYLAIKQMLCPVKAQIFRNDADAVLPEQPFPDFFGFVNDHGELLVHQAEINF